MSFRVGFTLAVVLLFALATALIEVPTSLGVRVPRPAIGQPDLSGSERIWRVWWRARDDLIDVSAQWLVTSGLLVLLAIFAVGMATAIWLVTGPQRDDDVLPRDG